MITPAAPADDAPKTFVYLVVYDRGPTGWAGLDRDRAHEYARNTEGVVAPNPRRRRLPAARRRRRRRRSRQGRTRAVTTTTDDCEWCPNCGAECQPDDADGSA